VHRVEVDRDAIGVAIAVAVHEPARDQMRLAVEHPRRDI
jgi:hypothetical protein